jgi:aromatic-L-amino-acid/L-tryptophan decarboxylase
MSINTPPIITIMLESSLEALRSACAAPLAHPSADDLHQAGRQAMASMLDDFLHLGEGAIGATAARPAMESLLREAPPEAGTDFTQLLAEFRQKVMPYAYRPSHPRFLAFIPGAPSYASILGDCLAGGTNLFAGVWLEAAGATQVEIIVLDWFKQFLGYPPEAMGLLTSGGSEANLTAFVTAREPLPLADRGRAVLYASAQRHWSVDRAVKIIGMAPEQVRSVPCDPEYCLRMDALMEAVAEDRRAGRLPWLLVANAGTTNTGSVDPLSELADFRDRHSLWLHVDAAYGWPAVLTDEGRSLLRGIERADSITLDPHKWFAQTFEAGCLLVRRGDLLAQTFTMRPEYMQDVIPGEGEINFCDHGIALTRRFRALKIWFSIKLLGMGWFRRLIEHSCLLAHFAEVLLERTGCFEITGRRKLSMVCFRFIPSGSQLIDAESDALQTAINDELTRTGRAFLSTTRLHGRTTLRLCFVNWRTTAADIEEIVGLLQEIGFRLALA